MFYGGLAGFFGLPVIKNHHRNHPNQSADVFFFDAAPSWGKPGDKKKVLIDFYIQRIEDLHMYLEEMSDRVEKLKTECPSDWSPIKKDIEKGGVNMRGKYEETMEFIGKASPVSIAG